VLHGNGFGNQNPEGVDAILTVIEDPHPHNGEEFAITGFRPDPPYSTEIMTSLVMYDNLPVWARDYDYAVGGDHPQQRQAYGAARLRVSIRLPGPFPDPKGGYLAGNQGSGPRPGA